MIQVDKINYLSEEGKVFKNIHSNIIFGWGICIGENDSIENYVEIDCPIEYKGNIDYDNTIISK